MSISRHDLTRAVITWGISFPPFLLLFLWLLLLSICPTSSNEIRLPLTSFPCVLFSVVVITLKEKKKNATLFSFQEFSSFFFLPFSSFVFLFVSSVFAYVRAERKGFPQRESVWRQCDVWTSSIFIIQQQLPIAHGLSFGNDPLLLHYTQRPIDTTNI